MRATAATRVFRLRDNQAWKSCVAIGPCDALVGFFVYVLFCSHFFLSNAVCVRV